MEGPAAAVVTTGPVPSGVASMELMSQGAEARIYRCRLHGEEAVCKERFVKRYRHEDLDRSLRTKQFTTELRSILRCTKLGLRVATVLWADVSACRLFMRFLEGPTVKQWLVQHETDLVSPACKALAKELGRIIAQLHGEAGLVHGDLTTSNFLVSAASTPERPLVYVLDFGLAYNSTDEEDFAVDLYVLERSLLARHPKSEQLFVWILKAYRKAFVNAEAGAAIVKRLTLVRQRGRKKIAFG